MICKPKYRALWRYRPRRVIGIHFNKAYKRHKCWRHPFYSLNMGWAYTDRISNLEDGSPIADSSVETRMEYRAQLKVL